MRWQVQFRRKLCSALSWKAFPSNRTSWLVRMKTVFDWYKRFYQLTKCVGRLHSDANWAVLSVDSTFPLKQSTGWWVAFYFVIVLIDGKRVYQSWRMRLLCGQAQFQPRLDSSRLWQSSTRKKTNFRVRERPRSFHSGKRVYLPPNMLLFCCDRSSRLQANDEDQSSQMRSLHLRPSKIYLLLLVAIDHPTPSSVSVSMNVIWP